MSQEASEVALRAAVEDKVSWYLAQGEHPFATAGTPQVLIEYRVKWAWSPQSDSGGLCSQWYRSLAAAREKAVVGAFGTVGDRQMAADYRVAELQPPKIFRRLTIVCEEEEPYDA